MFGTDKQNAIANMQTVQSTLLSIQETMLKMQETILKNHVEMRGDINKLDNRVEMIQQTMEKNEAKIQSVEVGLDNVVKKVDILDTEMIASNKKMEEAIIYLEMEKAAFYLHFQNVIEEKEEDLGDIMADLISDVLQRDKQEILTEIDETYRIQTNYARRNRLP
ncbi:BOLL: Protein boule-like [Crotalus adamanteus]|uniref:BOLL: Protein boule-like n=1 Tax=Crotalus adamanteus TaxID=8729 RepID=A0AAW1B0N2_CROAD